MLAEKLPISTSGSAPDYPPVMRITTAILPALLLVLAAANCKGDDTPENLPGNFGEPCVDGALVDTPDGCVSGTRCYEGYCEESCVKNEECQPVDGWEHICVAGLCQLVCDEMKGCPSSLTVPLVCGPIGWCQAKDDDG